MTMTPEPQPSRSTGPVPVRQRGYTWEYLLAMDMLKLPP